jgi:phospholipase C
LLNRIFQRAFGVVIAFATIAGLNCGGTGSSTGVCVPGDAVACMCSNGFSGSQLCSSDGSYDACVCTGRADSSGIAGLSGGSGAAGSSGSAGAVAGTAGSIAGAGGSAGAGGQTIGSDASAPSTDGAMIDANSCDAGAICSGTCGDVSQNDRNCGTCGHVCPADQHCVAATCQTSKIQHVVLIVQENHTFDSYFGRYCQATSGSNPTCTTGSNCCEAAPAREPKGATPIVLDDDPTSPDSNFATDRDHTAMCELQQIDGGKMDGFVTGSVGTGPCLGPDCASPRNWALAAAPTVGPYWSLASSNALADRYFQPVVGSTSSNNMYFATARFEFLDNSVMPSTIGSGCVDQTGLCLDGTPTDYQNRTTIADLLMQAGKTFAVYADGFAEAASAAPNCPSPPSSCPWASCFFHPVACHGCIYDPSDIPFAYFHQLGDRYTKDYDDLQADLDARRLPNFSFVKAREYRNEHPNLSTLGDGIAFAIDTIQSIESSLYADSTLVLLTWDEGGGFFDHVAPPAGVEVDGQGQLIPYGTRVPLIAIGPFVRKGSVSHVQMEHSSIVRFLEYNFVGPVGQLGHNDAKVNNIGSLLDPSSTGVHVPER